MPLTNKGKREEISSPSSLISHYGSLVQSLSLQKKKKKERRRKKEGKSNVTSCSSPPEHNTILNEKNANSCPSRQPSQWINLLIYF